MIMHTSVLGIFKLRQ